jgi:signal transduction histidine kinase
VLLHAGYGLLSAWTDERMAILAARDSGMGIPAEAPAQAFDLFTQLKQRVPHAQGALEIG